MKIKCVGLDPSLTNTGIAIGWYNLETRDFTVDKVLLIETENGTAKTVRRNSDDLRRCAQIGAAIWEHTGDADVIFSEIPTGAQSARAAFAFGMVIGILAGITSKPGFTPAFIQVLPQDVKRHIPGGSKVTSKEEIMDWAVERWPMAGWFFRKVKGAMVRQNKNEHMADACAAINAGIQTDDFRNLCAAFSRFSNVK